LLDSKLLKYLTNANVLCSFHSLSLLMTDSEGDRDAPEFAPRSDEPTEIDELGFEPYVEAIQEFVTNDSTEPPLTISIEGEWGSGKSSFLQQLKRSLVKDGKKTVEFNPWKHEKQESLWSAFALKFVTDLRDELSRRQRLRKRGELLYQRYVSNGNTWTVFKSIGTVVALLVPAILLIHLWLEAGAGVVVDALGLGSGDSVDWVLVFQIGGILTAAVSYMRIWSHFRSNFVGSLEKNLLQHASNPGYQDKVGFLNSFHDDLEQIIDVYLEEEDEEGERVFIFIDDLDRCSVPKAADLMQAINHLMSDDDRLIFILGLDRKRVAAGMAAKHDELLNVLEEDTAGSPDRLSFGYQYLEKFIQIPFLVPEPKEDDIRRLISGNSSENESGENIRESWESITEDYDEKLDNIVDMVVPALGSNPRQVKRFMNLYQLRAVLAEIEGVLDPSGNSSSPDKISLEQLAKFVIISIQWPQLVSRIYNDPTAIEKLVRSTSKKEDVDLSGLDPWSSDPELLGLLTHGEGDEYDIQRVNVESLMKISPRVDIPAESQSGRGSINRKVQICQFVKSDSNIKTDEWDLDSITPPGLRVETIDYNTIVRNNSVNQSRPLQCYIWIVGPSFWNDDNLEELYQHVPSETEVILLDDSSPDWVNDKYPGAVFAESQEEAKRIVKRQLDLISNKDDDSVWQAWRTKAQNARDDYLHGA